MDYQLWFKRESVEWADFRIVIDISSYDDDHKMSLHTMKFILAKYETTSQMK